MNIQILYLALDVDNALLRNVCDILQHLLGRLLANGQQALQSEVLLTQNEKALLSFCSRSVHAPS